MCINWINKKLEVIRTHRLTVKILILICLNLKDGRMSIIKLIGADKTETNLRTVNNSDLGWPSNTGINLSGGHTNVDSFIQNAKVAFSLKEVRI